MRIPIREMTNEMSVFILQSSYTESCEKDFKRFQDLDTVIFLQSKVGYLSMFCFKWRQIYDLN